MENSLTCITCHEEMEYVTDLFDEDGDLFGHLYKCPTDGCETFAINPPNNSDLEEKRDE